MKVLFVSPFSPAKDGVGRYTENLMGGLKSVCSDCRFEVLPWNYQHKFGRLVLPSWRAYKFAQKMTGHDIVHIQFVASLYLWHLISPMSRAKRLNRRLKLVLTLHETNDNTPAKWFFDWLQNIYCRLADSIIVHSQYHLQLLAPQYQAKTVMIPLSVPPTGEGAQTKISRTILLPGFINPWKGHDIAIQAMPAVLKKFPDARLMIVGHAHNAVYFRHLQEMVGKLALGDKVVFEEGFSSQRDFELAFAQAGLILLPYRRIAMSAILAQAISYGTLAVMSDLVPLREYTLNRGIYFKSGDPISLAKTIEWVWTDAALRHTNLSLIKHLQQLYSTPNIAKQTAQLYRDLIS